MNQASKPTTLISSWLILMREKAIVLVAIVAIFLCFTYFLPIPLSRALIRLGNAQYSAKNNGLGTAIYNLALAFDSNLEEAVKQCAADKDQGQYELAMTHCSKVIEIDSNYATAYFNRGLAHMILGNYDQAIADYSKDIKLIPVVTRSYINRGTVYMNQQNYDAAIADFTKAIEINPRESPAWLNRGLVYLLQNKNGLAIPDCQKAIQLEEESWNAYSCLGRAFSNQGKYDLAINNFNKAIELAPNTKASFIYCMQGVTYTKLGDFESAVTVFEQGVKMDITNENDWCKMGLDYARQGKTAP
jgi:tetratricopeptide (TPR) repeat protein